MKRYAYDALYRLRFAEGRETTNPAGPGWWGGTAPADPIRVGSDPAAMRRYRQRYTLDANGNLLTLQHVVPTVSGAGWTRTMTYATDGSNRMETVQHGAGSAESVTHDGLGRMTAMPSIDELAWDAGGRLRMTKSASAGNLRTRYVYDGAGNRVRKVTEKDLAGIWTKTAETLYVGGIDVERTYVSGAVTEEIETLHLAGALVETRTIGTGTLLEGRWRLQHTNHLQSVCVETALNGAVISYEEYHPYGTTAYSAHVSALDARPKRYRYSGKERDEETGLYYYGARYLAPWMGRWTSPDPAGTVDGLNLYGFVSGSPIRFVDVSGTEGADTVSLPPEDLVSWDPTDPDSYLTDAHYAAGMRQVANPSTHPSPISFVASLIQQAGSREAFREQVDRAQAATAMGGELNRTGPSISTLPDGAESRPDARRLETGDEIRADMAMIAGGIFGTISYFRWGDPEILSPLDQMVVSGRFGHGTPTVVGRPSRFPSVPAGTPIRPTRPRERSTAPTGTPGPDSSAPVLRQPNWAPVEIVPGSGPFAAGGGSAASMPQRLASIGRETLLEGASAPVGRGGTKAGAALQSHAARPGSWLAELAQGGNAAKNAAAAASAILNVLDNGTATVGSHAVFGEVIKMRLADGAGAWWETNGRFIGFLERYTPR